MDGSGWEYLERYSEDYDKHIEKLNKQIERLQEQLNEERNARQKSDIAFDNIRSLYREAVDQLNEANELISLLFPLSMNKERALERTTEYMEKWGVK